VFLWSCIEQLILVILMGATSGWATGLPTDLSSLVSS